MSEYKFDENEVYYKIYDHWDKFMKKLGMTKVIIGISGGIDSTTCAELAKRICRAENVYGISMPCDTQKDMDDVNKVFAHTGINRLDFNIGDAFHSVLNGVENNGIEVSNQTRTNLPARLRMSTLYAFGQSLNALVINTCNLSEDILGWNSFGGDNIGSYAPIRYLTKTEVRKLAAALRVPNELVNKVPVDGLQPKSDEENFGFSYADFDHYLRSGSSDFKFAAKARDMYIRNKFKLDIIDLPGPEFDFPNYITNE